MSEREKETVPEKESPEQSKDVVTLGPSALFVLDARQQEPDRPVGYDAFVEKSIEQISQAIGLTASRDTCG